MPEPMISITGLTVCYGGRRVLDGVNLDIERGEIMVLLGGSGSGKSGWMLYHWLGNSSCLRLTIISCFMSWLLLSPKIA